MRPLLGELVHWCVGVRINAPIGFRRRAGGDAHSCRRDHSGCAVLCVFAVNLTTSLARSRSAILYRYRRPCRVRNCVRCRELDSAYALTLGGILSIFAGVFLSLRARVAPARSDSLILRLVMFAVGVVALAASVEPSSTVGAVAILIVLIGAWLICHLAFEESG